MASADAVTRKTVTVLFCDLAESTQLGERLDPETLRALLTRWHEAMRNAIERHEGTVEKFIGDAVMAVFGVPHVHEDDALRAVLAAVEMHEAVTALGLRVRIGVNTGEVVAGGETLVMGDAVNTAKRLEEAAQTGEILIGAATRRLVANAAELEPAGEVAARGKSAPVEAWRLLGVLAGRTPYARRLDAPLVGRADELAFLHRELLAAERERACRLVTLYGAAGVGKSRLATELVAGVRDRAAVVSARCLPYGDGITFLPLTELIQSAGGDDAVAAAVASEPDGELILDRIRAVGSSEETFWATRRLLETLARERPLLVCIEDVHWAEPTFLDLLEYCAAWSSDAAILLLCLARPELLEVRPRWGGAALALEPLTAAESEQLLDELAAEWPVAPGSLAKIADAAEGNPLFLEQMVAMLAEDDASGDVPPTIQALLAARLDRLDPAERAVLERAAVVGKEFWRSAVVHLSPQDERGTVGQSLLALARKEFVRPEQSTFLGDDGFRFRHALIRDAAYAEIPKRLRAELHEAFAAWLEPRNGAPELVGYHLEQAYLCGLELGEPDAALAERAGTLLAHAGEQAYGRDDVAAAENLFSRAVGLLDRESATRIVTMVLLGSTLITAGDFARARTVLEEAHGLARAVGDTRLEVRAEIELAFVAMFTTATTLGDDLVVTAERAIVTLTELGDDAGLARAWRLLSEAHVLACRWADRGMALERAIEYARKAGDRRQESSLVALLAQALHYGPTPVDAAIVRCEQLLAEAGEERALAAALMSTLGGLYAMRGEPERARALWAVARDLYEKLGLQHRRAARSLVAATIELLASDPAAAERELRIGYDTFAAMGETYVRSTLAAYLAAVLAELGRDDEAIALTRESEENAQADDVVTQSVWRSARARALASLGQQVEAAALAAEAVRLAEATDFLDLRAGALLDLASVLVGTSAGEAAEAAARARAEYERKGNLVGIRRAEALAPTVAS
ncbi:MAG TPA: adenylate/guanylate cyclase domain-containing protein [Gaiellaceae bacterium]|nr:adenylate/guanylate cyclase domain-containing protein [Gaiellaceae bacterium]